MTDQLRPDQPIDDSATPAEVSLDAPVIEEVTGGPADTAPVTDAHVPRVTRPHPMRALRRLGGGLSAVGVKELRGRMRGRRAFVVLTLYLLLLAGFAWMYELILEQRYNTGFSGTAAYASASIGQELFAGLMMVVTLLVVLLAPAFTAGAISLEREKQTLDLLVTTPISSLAIVIGKLLSALTYVFILIGASVPLTAVVFVFGGVAPDDVIRGYIVLLATAFGLGAFGLFCSSLVKRTQAATVITTFGVMAMTLGSIFILLFWGAMTQPRFGQATSGLGPIKGRPPEAVAYFNPFIAQADVVCGTQTTFGTWCSYVSTLLNGNSGVVVFSQSQPGLREPAVDPVPEVVVPDVGGQLDLRAEGRVANVAAAPNLIAAQPFGVTRDAFWPRSVAAWLVLSVILIVLSVQLVSPTRRWRAGIRRRAPRRT